MKSQSYSPARKPQQSYSGNQGYSASEIRNSYSRAPGRSYEAEQRGQSDYKMPKSSRFSIPKSMDKKYQQKQAENAQKSSY